MTQGSDPYLPPNTEIAMREDNRAIVPASKGRRFGTLLVDYVAFLVISFCIGAFVALAFGEDGVKALQRVPDTLLGCIILSG